MIRSAAAADAQRISEIYNHYVANTVITFEEEAIGVAEMGERIAAVLGSLPWLVAEENGVVIGYAYATPWRARSAYRFAVESTVYLSPNHTRRDLGSQLYRELIAELRALKLHTAIGVIALPNPASIAIHERMGFKRVAELTQVGWKFNRWVDVGYWQLML
jgi:L-amino acid N-acyltransferase YncA